jgi:hypothetical protein
MCKDDREIFVGGYWDPPVHNMGSCSRPGEDPNAWKPFGPKHLGTSAVPSTVGRGGALFCFRYSLSLPVVFSKHRPRPPFTTCTQLSKVGAQELATHCTYHLAHDPPLLNKFDRFGCLRHLEYLFDPWRNDLVF